MKRKVEADAHAHVLHTSKRTCNSQQDRASTLGCLAPPYTGIPFGEPEAKSIYAIMRQHHGSRLYVLPVAWTTEHLRLLECKFLEKEVPQNERKRQLPTTVGLQVSDDSTTAVKKIDTTRDFAIRAAMILSKPCAMEARGSTIVSILAACGIKALEKRTSLPFHFDRRVVHIQVDGIFGPNLATPSLAYIDLDRLHSLRGEHVRRKFMLGTIRREKENSPVAKLIEKNLHRLNPQNEIEDPYIVAALVALAQQQYRKWELRDNAAGVLHDDCAVVQPSVATSTTAPFREQEDSFLRPFKVHLLAVPGTIPRNLYLYAARIPPVFLDKFDQPSKFSPSGPIPIVYYSLPLRNARKLPKRLLRALRAPVE